MLPEETLAEFPGDVLAGTDWEVEWVQLPEATWGQDRRVLVDGEYPAHVFSGYHGEVRGDQAGCAEEAPIGRRKA